MSAVSKPSRRAARDVERAIAKATLAPVAVKPDAVRVEAKPLTVGPDTPVIRVDMEPADVQFPASGGVGRVAHYGNSQLWTAGMRAQLDQPNDYGPQRQVVVLLFDGETTHVAIAEGQEGAIRQNFPDAYTRDTWGAAGAKRFARFTGRIREMAGMTTKIRELERVEVAAESPVMQMESLSRAIALMPG